MVMKNNDQGDAELDRFLSETEILPSSGFTASVMDAVRREAAAPPAIPFPWKRALPGIIAGGAMLGAVLIVTLVQLARGGPATPLPPAWDTALHSIQETTLRLGGPWIALALLVSLACMKFAALFVPRRA
jgi:hypothetical protein